MEKDADGDGQQPWTFDYNCLSFRVNSLTGQTDNAVDKYDLNGAVRFSTGRGCAPFNYGLVSAAAPVKAPATTAPTGSGSSTGSGAGNGQSNGGDASGDGSGSGSTDVAGPVLTATTTTASGRGLARTGADLLVALAAGLVLVAGGSVLLARGRSID